ncbi:rab-GTPase-TBC domain-containing protein [Blastocladiella britannica]|nr:rab-GTPase-TBC domain-containing protein [Blastocladiella britannica]
MRARRQAQLYRILIRVISRHPFLHYYQGLHDIVTVLLLVLDDEDATARATEALALYFIRDAMHPSLEPVMQQMRIILPIIKNEDRDIYALMAECELHPYFCLSYIISWFSHDLTAFDDVCRLFDLFLSSNPAMPIYCSAAIVLRRKEELMDCERDFAMVHSMLSKLPRDDSVGEWVRDAVRLARRYPIESIAGMTGWTFDPK